MYSAEEARRERLWGPFPALRKALEDKKIPETFYGFDENMFAFMARLMEIAVLVESYESDIKETATLVGREEMSRDLHELEEALEDASYFFRSAAGRVRTLYRNLYRNLDDTL